MPYSFAVLITAATTKFDIILLCKNFQSINQRLWFGFGSGAGVRWRVDIIAAR